MDPNPLAPWINNFGVWIDEFELMGLQDCLDYTWDRALVHLSSEPGGERWVGCGLGTAALDAADAAAVCLSQEIAGRGRRCKVDVQGMASPAGLVPCKAAMHPTAAAQLTTFTHLWVPLYRYLSRPYGRVDRPKLKRRLLERCVASGVTFHKAKVCMHGRGFEGTCACARGGGWERAGRLAGRLLPPDLFHPGHSCFPTVAAPLLLPPCRSRTCPTAAAAPLSPATPG